MPLLASNLTIASAASTPGRAFGSPPAEAGAALGIFAAMLGNPEAQAGSVSAGAAEIGLDASTLLPLGLDNELAETLDASLSEPVDPQPVVAFVDALTQLKASLDRGEPLNAELLAKAEKALDALADALGLDLDTLPVPTDLAALLESDGLPDSLAQMLSPLAQSLSNAQPATDAAAISAESQSKAQLQALGDKLAALLSALAEDTVPADKRAALGLPADGKMDADIEAALARFAANATAASRAVPEEPALATPALKLTEAVLAGNSTETVPEAKPRDAATVLDRPSDTKPGEKNLDPIQRDNRPAPIVAPINADAAPAENAATAQAQAGPRVDSAATTRLVQQPGYQTSQQQLNLPQIAFELSRQVESGNTRFQIRLDPPELGRIDVRLDIDKAGQVSARLMVEKAETLDLMQRDQRGLERALQQAGIDANKTNLEFSLKQNPFAGQPGMNEGGQGRGNGGTGTPETAADEAAEPTPTVNLYRGTLQARGVNIIA